MKILQSYYTSCKIGQSGSSGFQFYSYSQGLTEEELLEIQRIGNYIAPIGLSNNPTKEEIEYQFPISFNYFKLKSGRVGVAQSVALVQDYSGRPGNFIAHALVLESGTFPMPAIDLYKSPLLRTDLTNEEWQTEGVPEKLPVLNIDFIQYGSYFTDQSISDFVTENEAIFDKMLNALIDQKSSGRRLIIADKNTEFWIAALSYAVPALLYSDLTFSTYSIDPANTRTNICGTAVEGGRFNLNDKMAADYQYYVFNISNNQFSQVNNASLYSNIANIALTISRDSFDDFQNFFHNFQNVSLDSSLDIIYKLYISLNETVYTKDWEILLDFAFNEGTDDYKHDFIAKYNAYFEEVVVNPDTDIQKLLPSLLKLANKDNFPVVFDIYISWLSNCILSESIDQSKLLSDNATIVILLKKFDQFATSFLSDKCLNKFITWLDGSPGSFYAKSITVILQNVSFLDPSPVKLFNEPLFRSMLNDLALKKDLHASIDVISTIRDEQVFKAIFLILTKNLTGEEAINIIKKSSIKAEKIQDIIFESNNPLLELQTAKFFINKSENKKAAFWKTIERITSNRTFSKEVEEIIINYLDNKLSEQEYTKIINLAQSHFQKSFLKQVIMMIESKSSIDSSYSHSFIQQVCELKQHEGIDGSYIFERIYILNSIDADFKIESIKNKIKFITNLTSSEFTYLQKLFNKLLPLVKSKDDAYYIVLICSEVADKTKAFDVLAQCMISNFISNKHFDGIIPFIQLLVYVKGNKKFEKIANFYDLIREKLKSILSKYSKNNFEEIEEEVKERVKDADLNKQISLFFGEVREMIESKLVNKVGNFFNSIFKK